MAKILKYKDINLLAAQDRRYKIAKEKKATAIRLPALILILVLLLMGGSYYLLYKETSSLEKEKEGIAAYLNDSATKADYARSLRMQDSAMRMVDQKESIAEILLNLSSYPDMTGDDFELIYGYAGERVRISGVAYDRITGVLAFDAECELVTGVPIFVAQLRMSGIFEDVQYEGYSEHIYSHSEELPPKMEPRMDEFGNPVINPLTEEPVMDEVPQSRAFSEKSYYFAVTALVKAPEPKLPGPDQSINGER